MTREAAINQILDEIGPDALVIASTGKISRELFELRRKRGEANKDFLMLGSMGCALAIGLGVAMYTDKQVVVLDGDGAFLMKMGVMATTFAYRISHNCRNLTHWILNNYCHDSTGGQPTDFSKIKGLMKGRSIVFDVEKGSRPDLGRPDLTPVEIKERFMAKVRR